MAGSQRDTMRRLFIEFQGDRESVLRAYEKADFEGSVRRTRNGNGVSSREYAIRLWANGVNQGWLSGSLHGTARVSTSKVVREINPLFEGPLSEMGRQWQRDPTRPRPTEEAMVHWSELVDEWCEDRDLPLLIRKGGHRAILGVLPSGRSFARCDNSPAHWAFMGCCAGVLPTIGEVKDQLVKGELPLAMARTRPEKSLIEAGTHIPVGGFISKSKYGQVNKFTDGRAYKLCHLEAVGLGSRGEVEDFEESLLRKHMKLLLSPSNMIVVPLEYAGVGECKAFLQAFIES